MERLVVQHFHEVSGNPKTSAANSKLWSARPEKEERAVKEAFPLFGISPSGSSLHSISEGWKKVENRKLSQLFYATDASLAFVFVNKSSAVTRGFIKGGGWPHPLSFLKVSGVSKGREENRNPLSPL